MVLLHRLGIRDTRCLRIYRRAVCDAIDRDPATRDGLDWKLLEPVVEQQLAMLEEALQTRVPARARIDLTLSVLAPEPVAGPKVARPAEDAVAVVAPAARPGKRPSGYVPEALSMEEKLREARKPIQKLLREDCVRACLIDLPTAERLIQGMAGRSSDEAEREVVDRLRESLQQQIRGFIRRTRGQGPWSNPRTQEELRQDVHRMHSVRGVLSMARHVRHEYRNWEREQGAYGILGLFSPRRKEDT
jgi:hypothetical protein